MCVMLLQMCGQCLHRGFGSSMYTYACMVHISIDKYIYLSQHIRDSAQVTQYDSGQVDNLPYSSQSL